MSPASCQVLVCFKERKVLKHTFTLVRQENYTLPFLSSSCPGFHSGHTVNGTPAQASAFYWSVHWSPELPTGFANHSFPQGNPAGHNLYPSVPQLSTQVTQSLLWATTENSQGCAFLALTLIKQQTIPQTQDAGTGEMKDEKWVQWASSTQSERNLPASTPCDSHWHFIGW